MSGGIAHLNADWDWTDKILHVDDLRELPEALEVEVDGEKVEYRRERMCRMSVFSMHDEGDFTFRCSECGKGYVEYEPPNYCPNCGARVVE